GFRGDAKLSTWLHRVAVNEAIDLLRRERRYTDSQADVSETCHAFSDEYFDGDEAEQLLRDAMETLPEAQRAVFALKYYEDRPYKEISEILGTSEGGLKANYHHAVEKIKKFLKGR
ncbi:MAG: sigma-70 family RNA polymerase sigma factor, partial [Prevotellaceae bacterium]|nr:sigma-70 family RNA polymerase sigma factor [Prevotellaceae bacterium]